MAKYDTTLLRNPRQQVILDEIQGGTVYLCSGTPGSSLAIPSAGSILSQHTIGTGVGSVASGAMTLDDTAIGQDSSANNSGTISYVVVANSGGTPVARWLVPSQMSVAINGGPTLTITQGLPVDIDSLVVNEGNA